MQNIVMGDETWVSYYNPELKRTSKKYRHTTSPRPKKIRSEKSCRKLMLTVFWDCDSVVNREFIKPGSRINSDSYCVTMETLKRRIRHVWPKRMVFLLQHDNARPHTSRETKARLEVLGYKVLCHPPYSPDLAPSDYYLFKHMRRYLKGIWFTTDDELQTAVSTWLRQQPSEFFENGMRKLILRWQRSIAADGDYVEV